MKKYALLLAFTGLFSNGFSQSNHSGHTGYLKGFVITTAGDTLRGKTSPALSQVRIIVKPAKKARKIKHKDILAYGYGRHTYYNIGGYYRLVVEGPVCFYVKDIYIPKNITPYGFMYMANMSYYVVKRPEEKEVTVLQALRSGTLDTSLAGIAIDITTNLLTDQLVNDQTTMFTAMKKIAAEYFKDYPELVEDLADKTKYNTANSIHQMVERYNDYKLTGGNKD